MSQSTRSESLSKAVSILFVCVPLLWSSSVLAAKRAKGPEVVVMRPADLPAAAQIPGQSMYLRAVGFSRYLYIEQDNGKRLVVFDVSRPARIKTVAEISLNTPRFQFLQAVTSKLVLVRLNGPENSTELGVFDLKEPKKPILRDLGDAEFVPLPIAASNSTKKTPQEAEITDLRQEITDKDMGSSFVLSGEGLWIIRHPASEEDFELRELQFYAD